MVSAHEKYTRTYTNVQKNIKSHQMYLIHFSFMSSIDWFSFFFFRSQAAIYTEFPLPFRMNKNNIGKSFCGEIAALILCTLCCCCSYFGYCYWCCHELLVFIHTYMYIACVQKRIGTVKCVELIRCQEIVYVSTAETHLCTETYEYTRISTSRSTMTSTHMYDCMYYKRFELIYYWINLLDTC